VAEVPAGALAAHAGQKAGEVGAVDNAAEVGVADEGVLDDDVGGDDCDAVECREGLAGVVVDGEGGEGAFGCVEGG